MPHSPRRARIAISIQFFVNGVLYGGILPRLPEIKALYGLNDSQYGLLVIAMPVGAMIAANLAGPVIRRYGALATASRGVVIVAACVALAVWSPWPLAFAGFMALAGFVDALLDSRQNVHGMAVERWYGKSIINSLHAAWSLGAATGGVIGAVCAGYGIPIAWQALVTGIVWSVVALVAAAGGEVPERFVRAAQAEDAGDAAGAGDGPRAATSRRHRFPWKLFLPIAALAMAGTLVEDVGNNWETLYLHREMGAPIDLAGLGFASMLAAQFIGRALGDPMTDRWGRSAVARLGGILIAVGGVLVVGAPHGLVAVAGFATAGFGTATLVPAAYAASDYLPGIAHGSGVAMLSWFMRVSFLVTSPFIGVIADALELRVAMGILILAGLVAAWVAHLLREQWREPAS